MTKSVARVDLLDVLNKVSLALSNTDLIPVLTHYWLTGGSVTAYNDKIAIEHPLDLYDVDGAQIVGALPSKLLTILKNSKARDVSFVSGDDEVLVKAASTRIKLPLLGPESFEGLFEMPSGPYHGPSISFSNNYGDFLDSLNLCLRSVGSDTGFQEHLGVTCVIGDDEKTLTLYATNDLTIAKAVVPIKESSAQRFVLSQDFCKAFLAMFKEPPNSFVVADDYVLAEAKSGLKLFGKLIVVHDATDFDGVLEEHLPKSFSKKAIPIPTKFAGILDRSLVIANQDTEGVKVSLSAGDTSTKLVFSSNSDVGMIKDTLVVVDHPKCSATFSPKLLKIGAANYDKMLFTDRVAVFTKKGGCYLVSAFGG